jgi:hypothetical protein
MRPAITDHAVNRAAGMSQRELVIESLLRRPDKPSAGRRS